MERIRHTQHHPHRHTHFAVLAAALALAACSTGRGAAGPDAAHGIDQGEQPVVTAPRRGRRGRQGRRRAAAVTTMPPVEPPPVDQAPTVTPEPPSVEQQPGDQPPVEQPPVDVPPLPPPMVDPPPPSCIEQCAAPVELTPLDVHVSPAGPDRLTAGEEVSAGCAVGCIRRGSAAAGDGGTTIDVEVETDTAADITLWLTAQRPEPVGEGSDGLRLRNGDAVARTTGDLDLFFSTTLDGLQQDTEYWVTVRAVDAGGGRSWATGAVRTQRVAFSVILEFVEIDLVYDGDHGRNRGELTFTARHTQEPFADRHGTWGDGSRIGIDATEWSIGFTEVLGDVPAIAVTAVEEDPRGIGGLCTVGSSPAGAGIDADCDIAWNTALVDGLNAAEIAALPQCEAFGVEGDLGAARCRWVSTVADGQGMPEFRILVAYSDW